MTEGSETFDFIVAGAGSAGCAVAARLSESGRYRVLLLEAGPRDLNPWIHVPIGTAKLYADPRVNWMYRSEAEPALGGRSLYQPRGKVLGGTSSINGMLYVRGHARDYDEWRQRGCIGWDWDSVLPFFRKAEDQERGEDAFHGVGGPLRVSNHAVRWKLAERWIEAAHQAGLPPNLDFNNGSTEGVGPLQSTTYRSRRWSAATAYLRPARRRSNLRVVTGALATRILVEDGRAVGIAYSKAGRSAIARARGEVIVCGGVYNAPQLLQLSGIGPGAQLQELGISVTHDLPAVGSHLQDHFCIRPQFRVHHPITLNDVVNNPLRRVAAGMQYVLLRRGPLASNGIAATAFTRSDPRLERPDIQLSFTAFSFAGRDEKGVQVHRFPGFSVSTVHLRPDARGEVRLKTPDPAQPPSIRFNFLQTDYDLRALTTAMRLARNVAMQPALAQDVAAEVFPGAEVQTDAEFEACIRQFGASNMHPVGTCRMGPEASDTVVDPRLRVHGLRGLRVVDASIMPGIPAGNTNAPAIMIGEKGAAMILEDAHAA